ncbi:MFS transporter [Alicyclobacillus sp. ALC3]|uniref:MFS transporter n=1 Tax=Alicyclobacillus sp. ALC3 TaxID=2796143 RepID=UPI002378C345|nr:MFS transporter [Alicyclobacillus sp. ALC3]WDL95194.1 MFS transporter [Alicyclobacillus sp. ALC3]
MRESLGRYLNLNRWLEPELFQPFLLGILICLTISEFVRGALALSLLPTYGHVVLGFPVAWTALALSIQYAVDTALRAPAGWLIDRVGHRPVLAAGYATMIAAIVTMMHVETVHALLLAAALYGVGLAPVWPAAMSAISLATPVQKRAVFMSYLNLFWLGGAGAGPVVTGLVIGFVHSPHDAAAFWLLVVMAAVGLVLASFFGGRRTLAQAAVRASAGGASAGGTVAGGTLAGGAASGGTANGGTVAGGAAAGGTVAGGAVAGGAASGGTANGGTVAGGAAPGSVRARRTLDIERRRRLVYWRDLLRNLREAAYLFPGMFAQTFAIAALLPILSVYTKEVLHLGGALYAALLVFGGLLAVSLLVPAGKLVDRIGSRMFLIPGLWLAGVGLVLYPLHPTVPTTFAAIGLFGACYAFILPAWNLVQDESIDPDKKGTLWGVFMAVEGIGSATGPAVGGLLWDKVGTAAPFWASGGMIFAMGLLYLILPTGSRRNSRRSRLDAEPDGDGAADVRA